MIIKVRTTLFILSSLILYFPDLADTSRIQLVRVIVFLTDEDNRAQHFLVAGSVQKCVDNTMDRTTNRPCQIQPPILIRIGLGDVKIIVVSSHE